MLRKYVFLPRDEILSYQRAANLTFNLLHTSQVEVSDSRKICCEGYFL